MTSLPSPIEHLPNLLRNSIFGFLPPEDIVRSRRVCKKFEATSLDLRVWSVKGFSAVPKIRVIDSSAWLPFGFEIEDTSPLDCASLFSMARSWALVKDVGFTVMKIPKGLTINFLKEALGPDSFTDPRVVAVLETEAVSETYQMVITNANLINSTRKTMKDLRTAVNARGSEIPSAIELLSLMLLTKSVFGKHPYSRDDYPKYSCEHYTRCRDAVPWEGYSIYLSGYSSITGTLAERIRDCEGYTIGIGAVRRL